MIIMSWFDKLKADFILNFVKENRWKFITTGLGNTIIITMLALLIGVILGVLVAIIRSSYDKTNNEMSFGLKKCIFSILNGICKLYLTVIRGTPVVVQLMIMYYIIFASSRNSLMVAVIAFGINSGAYVAEIVRGGIMSIDPGQMEAGRAVGLSFFSTMMLIVIPQAIKNILPTLGNEFITLVKETSIVGFVGATDICVAFRYIGTNNYEFMVPYLVMALIYIVLVLVITLLIRLMERRLKRNERNA